jgi:hypothetical protein
MGWLYDLVVYSMSVVNNWAGYSTGGLIIALLWLRSVLQPNWKASKRFGLTLISLFLFLASFQAWREQHQRAAAAETRLVKNQNPTNVINVPPAQVVITPSAISSSTSTPHQWKLDPQPLPETPTDISRMGKDIPHDTDLYVCHLDFTSVTGGSTAFITISDRQRKPVAFMDSISIQPGTLYTAIQASDIQACRFFPGGIMVNSKSASVPSNPGQVSIAISGVWRNPQ